MKDTKENTTLVLKGEIISGRGIGKKRMESISEFFNENHLTIYPGTLNVIFSEPIKFKKKKAKLNYNNSFYFWKIKINGIKCFAYRWSQCPHHIIEIVSTSRLRDRINLDENPNVTIEIKDTILKKLNFLDLFFWNLVWKGRRDKFYTSDLYPKFIGKFINLSYRIKVFFGLIKGINK